MEEIKDFKEYCQEYLLDYMERKKGEYFYIESSSLADEATSYDMENGTIVHWEPKAEAYIREWSWDAGEFLDSMQYRFGKMVCNPFKRPGLFMVCMVREGIAILLNECPVLVRYKGKEKKITTQFLCQLKKELDEIREVKW